MAEPLSLTARFVAAPAVIPPVPTLAGVIAPLAPASPRLISGGALWRGVGRFSGSERATGCRRRCWPRTCLGATSRSLALREAALLSWPALLGGALRCSAWVSLEVLLGIATVVLDHHSPVLLVDNQAGQELHFSSHVVIRGLNGVGPRSRGPNFSPSPQPMATMPPSPAISRAVRMVVHVTPLVVTPSLMPAKSGGGSISIRILFDQRGSSSSCSRPPSSACWVNTCMRHSTRNHSCTS